MPVYRDHGLSFKVVNILWLLICVVTVVYPFFWSKNPNRNGILLYKIIRSGQSLTCSFFLNKTSFYLYYLIRKKEYNNTLSISKDVYF